MTDLLTAPAAESSRSPLIDASAQRAAAVAALGYGRSFVANAGGVIVSCFDWVQANQSYWWTEEQANQRPAERMTAGWHAVLDPATAEHIALRSAATRRAVERVAAANTPCGLYP
jgi:glutamate dehydrogenase (NAD(P)+)